MYKLSNVLSYQDWFESQAETFDINIDLTPHNKINIKKLQIIMYTLVENIELLLTFDYDEDELTFLIKYLTDIEDKNLSDMIDTLYEENLKFNETAYEITEDHIDLFEEYDVMSVEEWRKFLLDVDDLTVLEWMSIDYLSDRVEIHAEEYYDDNVEEDYEDVEDIDFLDLSDDLNIDSILDKINKFGINYLTDKQRNFLDNQS